MRTYKTDSFSARGKCYRSLDHKGAVLCSSVWNSVNIGNLLVTGCQDNMLRIWDLDSGLCSNILSGHTDSVISICLSPRDAADPVIGSGSADKSVILWSMESGVAIDTFRGHKGVVTSVAISEDLQLPVLVSCSSDRCIICWRLSDGQQLGSIYGHSAPVSALVLSNVKFPVIVSGSDDALIKVWDMVSGTLIETLVGHSSEVNTLALSRNPVNPIIVSGSADGAIIVWDLFRLKLKYVLVEGAGGGQAEVSSVAVADVPHPIIVSSTWTSALRIWDSKTGDLLRILDGVHSKRVADVRIGRDESGPVIVSSSLDGLAVVWSPEDDLFVESAQELSSLSELAQLDLEESLVIAGKYFCYWSMALQLHKPSAAPLRWGADDEDDNVSTATDLSRLDTDATSRSLPGRDLTSVAAAVIFHCILRLGTVNPQLVRTKAQALNFVLTSALPVVDLLQRDKYLKHSPLQFLIENRLCLQRTSEWMKGESNIDRIVSTLADEEQSVDTLDSILTAVVSNDRLGGWDMLLPNNVFEAIFKNLVMNCHKSHKKLAAMLSSHGLEVESEPYSSPLDVRSDRKEVVVRWKQVKKGKGIFCYRVKVNRHLPMDFLLSDEFLGAVATSADIEELVQVPLVQYLIRYSWESCGKDLIFYLGIFYAVYLMTTTVAVMAICTGEFVDLTSHLSYIICILVSIFCNTIWMGLTLWEWNKSSSHFSFLSNLWNISDVLMTVLCHFCIIVGTISGPIAWVRVMSTALTLLLWSHTLYFGRGQRAFAVLIHTMKVIVWDVRFFGLILMLFLLAFAISFRVLGVFESFHISFLRIFNMMFGDLHYDIHFEGHTLATTLYLIFLVSVVIILLNSLIAFMENSFRLATNSRDIAATISQLKLVTELKVKLFPLLSLYSKIFPSSSFGKSDPGLGDLVVLSPESAKKPDFSPIVSEADMLRKIDDVGRDTRRGVDDSRLEVNQELRSVDAKIQGLEERVLSVESKLDHIIHMLSIQQSRKGNHPQSTLTEGRTNPKDSRKVVAYTYFGDDDDEIAPTQESGYIK